jgi:hypothetical protein
MTDDRAAAWIDKLEIRELIEQSMRHIDDERAGVVGEDRPAGLDRSGQLLMHPLSAHLAHNPVIDVDGETSSVLASPRVALATSGDAKTSGAATSCG